MRVEEDTKKKTKDLKISLIVFALITIFTVCFLLYLNNRLPEFMMKQGKRYLEIQQYEKALKLFDMTSKSLPYSCEPIYYKAIAYSKMPQSYENQKILYEYSKTSDCDIVSEEVTKILNSMRNFYFNTSGENYIDNVLYKDKLIRWNNDDLITYYIDAKDSIPKKYIENIRRAFFNWQVATNGEIKLKEITTPKQAHIYIEFTDKINNENHIGQTIPIFKKSKLHQMRIKLLKQDKKKNDFSADTMLSVSQHEIGHALGLWGHSANKEDVMFYDANSFNEPLRTISHRDANTIITVYKMVPDIIDKPISEEQKPYLYFHNVLTTFPGENFEHEINTALLMLKENKLLINKWIELTQDFQKAKQYERANFILLRLLPYLKSNSQKRHIVLFNIAENYYKLKDYKNAYKFIKLTQLIKKDKESQLLDAILNIKLGEMEAAHLTLSILAHDYPADVEIALNLAKIYNMVGDKTKEKQVIKNLVKNNPTALKNAKVLQYKNNKKN